MKNIDETRNYVLEEKKPNEFMTRKHKKVCTNSFFTSLICILIGIMSSAIGLKICAIATGVKKYKSVIKKNKKKLDKIVLLAKSKLNSIEDFISKALIDSNINHDEFVFNE